MQRKFLWRPDPPSVKDWRAETLLASGRRAGGLVGIPDVVKLTQLVPNLLDQGGLGSCTANATAYGLRGAQIRRGAVAPPFASRLFLYYYARCVAGNVDEDSGSYLRANLDAVRKLGFCPEAAWPYSDDDVAFKLQPGAAAVRLAYDQKGDVGYYRVDSVGAQRSADIRAALAAGYLVIFGTLVGQAFVDWKPGDPPLDPPAGATLGGHALTIAGYGPGYFDIVNSWGSGWGDGGWGKLTSAYIESGLSADFWIIEAAPDFSEVP